ncbi:hypothetical protein KKC1_16070 [Calderihabitans maritimus]|uniref:Uncharacterized protein n=1 Tax=Calderihabitans maritimus TaxID=1246530 RepID=A0A1Z5HSF4_9FIRM|nr:hypothetical protein KKC1_16070 [Calderihabitans maritimus]
MEYLEKYIEGEDVKVPVRGGHSTILSDHEISEYFSLERFPLFGLRCDFHTCCRHLRRELAEDKEAQEIISQATSFQELIKSFIRRPSDVHSLRGQALQKVTGLHPVFLDWISDPYWEDGQFPFNNFPEKEFAIWEKYKKSMNSID